MHYLTPGPKMAQNPRSPVCSQNLRLHALNGSRAAFNSANPSFSSTSIRLQNRFGILTGKNRCMGVGKYVHSGPRSTLFPLPLELHPLPFLGLGVILGLS